MGEKAKTIKLDRGTIYQKATNGSYYFRYQINGQRKAISLKTQSQKEAIAKAEELLPVVKATSTEVISAHVQQARNLSSKKKSLPLLKAWEIYSKHPDRARPATVSEQNAYKSTFHEFLCFLNNSALEVRDITYEIADKFDQYLRAKYPYRRRSPGEGHHGHLRNLHFHLRPRTD